MLIDTITVAAAAPVGKTAAVSPGRRVWQTAYAEPQFRVGLVLLILTNMMMTALTLMSSAFCRPFSERRNKSRPS